MTRLFAILLCRVAKTKERCYSQLLPSPVESRGTYYGNEYESVKYEKWCDYATAASQLSDELALWL